VQALVLSLFLTGTLLVGFIIALLLVQPSTPAEVAFIVLLLGLPAAGCLWLTVFVIRRLRRMRRPLMVLADSWGLAWETATGRRRWARLPWHEMRSFFVIREPDISDDAFSVFVAQGEGARLAWALPRAPSPEQLAANERLVRLAGTHTHLPLAVVSAARLSPEDYDVPVPESSPITLPMSGRTARFLSLAFRVPFLLSVLLPIAGFILEHT